jgi:hypothetical protein
MEQKLRDAHKELAELRQNLTSERDAARSLELQVNQLSSAVSQHMAANSILVEELKVLRESENQRRSQERFIFFGELVLLAILIASFVHLWPQNALILNRAFPVAPQVEDSGKVEDACGCDIGTFPEKAEESSQQCVSSLGEDIDPALASDASDEIPGEVANRGGSEIGIIAELGKEIPQQCAPSFDDDVDLAKASNGYDAEPDVELAIASDDSDAESWSFVEETQDASVQASISEETRAIPAYQCQEYDMTNGTERWTDEDDENEDKQSASESPWVGSYASTIEANSFKEIEGRVHVDDLEHDMVAKTLSTS